MTRNEAIMAKSPKGNGLEFTAVYHQSENGWVIAEVLDFPGVVSQGRTLKSAQRMLRDALRLMAECTIEEGLPLPRPNRRAKSKKAIYTEKVSVPS